MLQPVTSPDLPERFGNPATRSFIRDHAGDDVLALLLCKNIPPEVDVHFAMQQIEGRQKARAKLPALAANPDFIFPAKLAMEQCSSECTARYKAQLFTGKAIADITGGLGVDALYAAECAKSVIYVEKNEALCALARHNFLALGVKNVEVSCGDGIKFLQRTPQQLDAIYLDPSRRDSGGNSQMLLADCSPNVLPHQDFLLSKAATVMLKASPMLDITQALRELRHVRELHVVAVKNDCKELLFVCREEEREGKAAPLIRCVNIHTDGVQRFNFSLPEERSATAIYAENLKRYLYEPNVTLLKAGALKLPCRRFGVEKLHPDTHLYTSNSLLTEFPGRAFEVQHVFTPRERSFKSQMAGSKANITVRNFPLTVAEIRKKYGIKEGGSTYLFAATLCNGERRIIKAEKVQLYCATTVAGE
ncbi:MAG: class I SAM-dependent methyltransferase [Prevotellaceae bacterium]|jgi:precorrin-6B methylase 2|nr:class I SAM-dependent methyltransferase [Prevotellaceae bacterium]